MVRRFAIVVVLIFMSPWPFFQSVTFSVMSVINCSYLTSSMPLQDKKVHKIEVFNEISIYVCSVFVTTMINVAIPRNLNNLLGWLLMGVATFNILVNLTLIVISSISDCIASI